MINIMGFGDYGCTIENCPIREYIIVVGAEDYYTGAGEKLMFMAQAVRYVRLWSRKFDLTSVFYFQGVSATSTQCSAFKDAVIKYGGVVSKISEWSAIASHINNRQTVINGKSKQKQVQVLIFFAHGTPSKGIWLSSKEGKFFTAAEASTVDASAFIPKSNAGTRHVTSWACQTGNAGENSKTAEYNMTNSLAQALADFWDIKVYASATKTDYSNTWGTGISGLIDDWSGHRSLIDGAVWEPDGADGSVFSSDKSSQGDMPQGMHRFMPGQTTNYQSYNLD